MAFPSDLTANAIFVGKPAFHWEGRPASAIKKEEASGRRWLSKTGLDGDEQADLSVHGGPEKALHHHAADHYAFWRDQIPDRAEKFKPGGFGENLSTIGLTEEIVCIGDVIQIGEAIVQISQGRQPCWKLSKHIGRDDMAARFQKSGRTGWYYRVLQEGFIQPGEPIALIERPQPRWQLAAIIAARFDPRLDPALAREISLIAELSDSWRRAFVRKSNADYVEDTNARLHGD